MPGKVFDGSAPCGPALVTPDEAGDHDAIEIALTLNGEEMQRGSTADLVHSVPALVAYLSQADDARAGRHRLHRDPGRGRQPARPAGMAEAGRRGGDQLAPTGRARDPARLGSGHLDLLADGLGQEVGVALRRPDGDGRVRPRAIGRGATGGRRRCAARARTPDTRLVAAALELLGQADDRRTGAAAAFASPLRCERAELGRRPARPCGASGRSARSSPARAGRSRAGRRSGSGSASGGGGRRSRSSRRCRAACRRPRAAPAPRRRASCRPASASASKISSDRRGHVLDVLVVASVAVGQVLDRPRGARRRAAAGRGRSSSRSKKTPSRRPASRHLDRLEAPVLHGGGQHDRAPQDHVTAVGLDPPDRAALARPAGPPASSISSSSASRVSRKPCTSTSDSPSRFCAGGRQVADRAARCPPGAARLRLPPLELVERPRDVLAAAPSTASGSRLLVRAGTPRSPAPRPGGTDSASRSRRSPIRMS